MPDRITPGAVKPATIRTAALEDIPAILAIEQSTPMAVHWSAEQYQARIGNGKACFLVAESQGQIVGFLCANIVVGEWEIENVVVDETSRRHGLGSQLMRAVIARWQKSGSTVLLLEVRESNVAARALYARHSLHETGRRRAYYRDPVEDAVLYAFIHPQ
jgi:ribosomal-protein-alanine N-acetyltransferase